MNRRGSRVDRGAPQAVGGSAAAAAAAAAAAEAAAFEDAIRAYFRVDVLPKSKSRKRPRTAVQEPDDERDRPATHLKRIKQSLRDAPPTAQTELVQRVLDAVLVQLRPKKTSPTAFERAVTLSRELFQRSSGFRKLVTNQTAQFYDRLLAAAGEDVSRPAVLKHSKKPTPQLAMALALIEQWKEAFGDRYLPLVAGYDVLVSRGYSFPRSRETEAAASEEAHRVEAHLGRIRELKAQQRSREMAQFMPEMEALLVEMDQVFEILVPTLDAFQMFEEEEEAPKQPVTAPARVRVDGGGKAEQDVARSAEVHTSDDDDDDDVGESDIEWEEVEPDEDAQDDQEDAELQPSVPNDGMDMNEIVQAYGLGSSAYQLTIEISTSVCERSAENEVLFRTLADGILRLRKRFLPLVSDWMASAERGDEELRRVHELQHRMRQTELKWEDLVRESERKRFARLVPAVVTVPSGSYDPHLPEDPRRRRS